MNPSYGWIMYQRNNRVDNGHALRGEGRRDPERPWFPHYLSAGVVGAFTGEILVLKRPGTLCGSYEGDPLSPPEGEAAQGGKPP